MTFPDFAALMEKIGFRSSELVNPTFTLTKKDLRNSAFKNGAAKLAACYRVVSMWDQGGQVALWAVTGNSIRRFPFVAKEVDFLAQNAKFH